MNRTMIGANRQRALRVAALLTTASLAPLFAIGGARAQADGAAPIEEVLVTGSLIHGAAAVGVPVTSLGAEEFQKTGSVSISDLFRTVPQVSVVASGAHIAAGASLTHSARVNIHNLGFFRSLVLYDGMRYPPTGVYVDGYDPEIIPSIAVDHIDVLADGASATYGSDALAGVINVILKRGFDGATTQLQYNFGYKGGDQWQASQLFGRKWDGGDVTVSFSAMQRRPIWAKDRPYLYTFDFSPWHLDNRTPLSASIPAIVSVGAAALPSAAVNPFGTQGAGCTNCLNAPQGTNGVGLAFSQFTPVTMTNNNLVNPWRYAQATGPEERAGATITFDQDITGDVSLFVDGFYANRKAPLLEPAQNNPWNGGVTSGQVLPTNNPYYPIGAPAGLRVNFSLAAIDQPDVKGKTDSARYDVGLNLKMPFNWVGKVFFNSGQEDSRADVVGAMNNNNIRAALGQVITDPTGRVAPYTVSATPIPGVRTIDPSVVPFLNPFCDPRSYPGIGGTCMPQALYNFITAYWIDVTHVTLQQVGANFDGPVLNTGAGEARAAIGATFEKDDYDGKHYINTNTISTEFPAPQTLQSIYRESYAVFGQLNIPLASEMQNFPLIEKLDLEISGRFDHYSDFGHTANPKVAVNWVPVEDLTVRASYGTSFRAPSFNELSPLTGKNVSGTNIGASQTPSCPNGTVGGTPVPGSAGAIINPTCSAALMFPQIASMNGGALIAPGLTRPPNASLGPEKAYNFSYGVQYTPANVLRGLDVQATYFQTAVHNYIGTPSTPGGNILTNPGSLQYLFVKNNPADPGNVNFNRVLVAYTTSPFAASNVAASGATLVVLQDGMFRNLFRQFQSGVDASIRYDWDSGDLGLGVWNIGANATYLIKSTSQDLATNPVTDSFNDAVNHTANNPHTHARMQLGWMGDFGLSATLYANYTSHYFSTETPPIAQLRTPLCATCLPFQFMHIPALYTFDFSLVYDLGDLPANEYLKGLTFQAIFTNFLNKKPPFQYKNSSGGGGVIAYDGGGVSPAGRIVTIAVTKNW